MAIPGWIWPESSVTATSDEQTRQMSETTSLVEVQSATNLFSLLSNTTRVEILMTLADSDEPLAYTVLHDALSIDDKGQFNYHLRQLDEFIHSDSGSYSLTSDGEALVERILTESEMLARD